MAITRCRPIFDQTCETTSAQDLGRPWTAAKCAGASATGSPALMGEALDADSVVPMPRRRKPIQYRKLAINSGETDGRGDRGVRSVASFALTSVPYWPVLLSCLKTQSKFIKAFATCAFHRVLSAADVDRRIAGSIDRALIALPAGTFVNRRPECRCPSPQPVSPRDVSDDRA